MPTAMIMVALLLVAASCHAQEVVPPAEPDFAARDLCLQTALVRDGQPAAVIVTSSREPTYRAIAEQVRDRIAAITGVALPVVDAEAVTTDEVLTDRNAIALGNLVTSRFVETLYHQWFTICDRFYPGVGGYEVRSLHDPYGTGRNVILLGGSDLDGVRSAAEALCAGLEGGPGALSVGRLMEIVLPEDRLPPPRGFNAWCDPRLRIVRWAPSGPMGWSLAAKHAMIYYWSGDEQYARSFRDLALSTNQFSGLDHYSSHCNALIWDLIEESPVFSDEDRVAINRKLFEHTRTADSAADIERILERDGMMLDRHSSMRAIVALTEARFFGTHWPDPYWDHVLDVVRRYFDRQMVTGKGDSDLGGRGIYTYLECALIPALLLRDERFEQSGALRHFAELVLMHCDNTGYTPQSGQGGALSFPEYSLRAAAALLDDGGFLMPLLRREEAERIAGSSVTTSSFMTGQPWTTDVQPEPMAKMIGVYALPLTDWEWEQRGQAVAFEKSLDKLTMRTGFERDDQYLLLDGIHGGPASKPWPDANAIVAFGQNGRILIDNSGAGEAVSQHNVVTASWEGLGVATDRAASLEAIANLPTFGYSHSRVTGYAFCSWDRHILWRKGGWFVVIDRMTPDRDGAYSFECRWQTVGEPELSGSDYTSTVQDVGDPTAPRDVLTIRNAEGYRLRYHNQLAGVEGSPVEVERWRTYCAREGINHLAQVAARTLTAGEELAFTNLIYVAGDRTRADYRIARLGPTSAVLSGTQAAWVGVSADGRPFDRAGISASAGAWCISAETVALVDATALSLPGIELHSAPAVNVELDLATGALTCEAREAVTLSANGEERALDAGITQLRLPAPAAGVAEAIRAALAQDARESLVAAPTAAEEPLPELPVQWRFAAGAPVSALHCADVDGDGAEETLVGLEDGRALCLDADGRERWSFQTGAAVRALGFAELAAGPTVLVGSDDQKLYALPANGGEPRWSFTCSVAPDSAGWTTRQEARLRAILPCDLDRDGSLEIICGTGGGAVEAVTETGEQKWFTPIRYGVPDRLAVCPMADGSFTLFVSCAVTSYQSMTRRLDAHGRILDENALFRKRGADMSPAPGLLVRDLDGDGAPEVMVGRGGAYPELAVYDAASGAARWTLLLADTAECVAATDLTGDGVAEVIAAGPSAWVTAFSPAGDRVWSTHLPHRVLALAVAEGGLLAACADGAVYGLDAAGATSARLTLAGTPLASLAAGSHRIVAADDTGLVVALPPRLP
ncbi:MAG: PQQ-binding-like beta-propeller repeat protein [Armatimonadota bacterium]